MGNWTYKFDLLNDNTLIDTVISESRNIDMTNKSKYHDPMLLPDIDKACSFINKAVENLSPILIYGDYDADGLTSSAIMFKYLSNATPFVDIYIPDRFAEGYGMNTDRIKHFIEDDYYKLVITVDNGITAFDQVELLKSAGIDVVITDHHTCQETLPNADAIVNCHRVDSLYPMKDLCGAGVAYKIVSALESKYSYGYSNMDELRELAMIGTIADVVPLVDENRSIVKDALSSLRNTSSIPIRAIISASEKLKNKNPISSEDIAYNIAPLINCASRMGNVSLAVSLFTSTDYDQSYLLAMDLIKLNEARKTQESIATTEAMEIIFNSNNYTSEMPIVVAGQNWNKGIIGITAAKIAEKFQTPAYVCSISPDNIIHGSVRSFGDYNVVESLKASADNLIAYGGHVGAGGFSLELKSLQPFIDEVTAYSLDNPIKKDNVKVADALISIKGISNEYIEKQINPLGPFGESNPNPIFISKDVSILKISAIGKDKGTLKMVVMDDSGNILNCIGFGMAYFSVIFNVSDRITIIYNLSQNSFAGRTTPQAQIIEIESPKINKIEQLIDDIWPEMYNDYLNYQSSSYTPHNTHEIPTNEEYVATFPVIKSLTNILSPKYSGISLSNLLLWVNRAAAVTLTPSKLLYILEAINDSHHLSFKITSNQYVYLKRVDESIPKIKLSQTPSYKNVTKYRATE